MRVAKLKRGESIVTAYAESAAGPGWANTPIWLVVRDANQSLRMECIQPSEHTAAMHTLYKLSQAAHQAMSSAAREALERAR